MHYPLHLLWIALGVALGLSGCEDCGTRGEPTLTLQFSDTSRRVRSGSAVFSRVYGLNGNLNRTNVALINAQTLQLPLALTADSTSYVFVRARRTDTLVVHYRRLFSYQSDRCGYVLSLEYPAKQPLVKASFRNALGFFDGGRSIFSGKGPRNTGITVSATL